jgi:hypothetical protein
MYIRSGNDALAIGKVFVIGMFGSATSRFLTPRHRQNVAQEVAIVEGGVVCGINEGCYSVHSLVDNYSCLTENHRQERTYSPCSHEIIGRKVVMLEIIPAQEGVKRDTIATFV